MTADINQQREYIEWLRAKLGWTDSLSQLYNITQEILEMNHGYMLMEYYSWSPTKALATLYPEHQWLPWRFKQAPKGWWSSVANQRAYVEWLMAEFGAQGNMDALYQLTTETLIDNDGATLIWIYSGSPSQLVMAIFPEHTWQAWRFNRTPVNTWERVETQSDFVRWLRANELALVGDLDRLHNLTPDIIRKRGGAALLELHDSSVLKFVEAVFPEHPWLPWRFQDLSASWWRDVDHQRRFVDWVRVQLFGADAHTDALKRAMIADIERLGGTGLLALHSYDMVAVLSTAFPEHEWLPWLLADPPPLWWTHVETQKRYLKWLLEEVGVRTLTKTLLQHHHGYMVLHFYNQDVKRLLAAVAKAEEDDDVKVVPLLLSDVERHRVMSDTISAWTLNHLAVNRLN